MNNWELWWNPSFIHQFSIRAKLQKFQFWQWSELATSLKAVTKAFVVPVSIGDFAHQLVGTAHREVKHHETWLKVLKTLLTSEWNTFNFRRPFQKLLWWRSTVRYLSTDPFRKLLYISVWVCFYVGFRTTCCDIATRALLLCRKLLHVSSRLTADLDRYIPYFTVI